MRENFPNTEFFSGPYFAVFGTNTGKYGPEKTPYLDTFNSFYFPLFIKKPYTNRRGEVSEIITSLHYIRNLQQDQEKITKTNKNPIEKNLNRKKTVSKPKQPVKTNKQRKLFSKTKTNVDKQEWPFPV